MAYAPDSREVVDVVRREEAKKQDEAGRKLIKGSRYLLLKKLQCMGTLSLTCRHSADGDRLKAPASS